MNDKDELKDWPIQQLQLELTATLPTLVSYLRKKFRYLPNEYITASS
jgi:hypothetical protein